MSRWHDTARWAALCDGSECPICVRGTPLNVLIELEGSWLTMSEDAPMRGYVCLVSKHHAVELHDLDEAAATTFMRDVRCVSRALAQVLQPVKLNYEIHGNTLPHLHMHFFPRYRGDRFEGQPIDPKPPATSVYAARELAALQDELLRALRGS